MGYDYVSSLPAYKEKGKDFTRQQVFIAIRKLGICNDRMIAEYLGWPINCVTNRRGELVTIGLVVFYAKQLDKTTNRTVSYWQVKPLDYQPKLF
jgi:hypothetical protein